MDILQITAFMTILPLGRMRGFTSNTLVVHCCGQFGRGSEFQMFVEYCSRRAAVGVGCRVLEKRKKKLFLCSYAIFPGAYFENI